MAKSYDKGGKGVNCAYKHEGNRNYMTILRDDIISDYRIEMLKRNEIKGLLSFKVRYHDNKSEFCYEISAKQSLKEMFMVRKIEHEEIEKLLIDIKDVFNEIQRYMLSTNDIILNPENIFIDINTMNAEFVCLPDNETEFKDGIRNLCRFFLEIINHNDKKLVEYTYNTYCKSMQDNLVIEDLIDLKNEEIADYMQVCESDTILKVAEPVLVQQEEKTFVDKVVDFVKGIKNTKLNDLDLYIDSNDNSYEESVVTSNTDYKKHNELVNDFSEFENSETVLLNVMDTNPKLICVDDGCILEINRFPYLLGKMKACVNGIIQSENVSRIHAKIYSEDNEIFIEDMNSKNGTFLNGNRINPYEKVKLSSEDKISFANVEYIYKNSI